MSHSFSKILISHAPKYIGASAIASATTLLMTKYYTAVFAPSEFGVLALYLVMFQYVTSLVSLNLDSGSTRFYFDYRSTQRDTYLSTIFWLITMIALVVLIIGLMTMPIIADWIAPNSRFTYFATILTAIGAVYVSFLTRVLYNEHKSTSVFKHTIFQSFINHTSSVIFISVFHLGIFGRIGGQGLGYFFNIFTLIKEFSKNNLFRLQWTFNKAMAKETFLLTLPSMTSMLLGVAFLYTDRFFIKHYLDDTAVGIYTLGYMLGQGLSIVYEAISQTILPKVFSDMNHSYDKAVHDLESFSYKYYFALMVITILVSILSPLIISIFSNRNYIQSADVMPFVIAGFMLGGFYKIPSLVLGYHKVVWFYPFLSILSFGMNVLLNWWMIPLYGIIGSAFASFIGLFIYSLIMQIFAFKYTTTAYNFKIIVLYVVILFSVILLFLGA